ncbi:MAG: acetyl-CoA C-acyltransferase [Holophagaceae bacterium]|nr:acetyl-CoA C-acyltransferase [Holophagaceae bacterium]
MNPEDIVLLAGKRTPFAEYNGQLRHLRAQDLGIHAAKGALAAAGVEAGDVDHVVMGMVLQTTADGLYAARHVGLGAGCPVATPALIVNRLCGSGLEALQEAARLIRGKEAAVVLAGGMEAMSQAPFVLRGDLRTGLRLGAGRLEDSLMQGLYDPQCGLFMAQTAENIARDRSLGREAQDAFAAESQRRADAAWNAGVFAEEVLPITVAQGRKTVEVERDDHLKPGTTAEVLARLAPAFGKEGTVTGGNASGIVDGAAAMVVTSASEAARRGWRPLARIAAYAAVGVEPDRMGLGPVPAIRKALAAAGLTVADMDLVEVNEAFAAQCLAVMHDLDLDPARTNVNGGAIALGHPLGASGARLALHLSYRLRAEDKRWGLASLCVGGGMGVAMVLERC